MAKPRKKETAKNEEAVAFGDVAPQEQTPKKKIKLKAKLATAGTGRFDIFSEKTQVGIAKEMLAKINLADGFKSAGEVARDYMPVPHIALQYLIGRIGIPARTVIEFIGQENVGKSSLVFYILGTLIQNNTMCLYVNCEPKMTEPDWMDRLVCEDTELARKIKDVLVVSEGVTTFTEMDALVRNWVHIMRHGEKPIPMDVPLCVTVDPYTKLLDAQEAEMAVGNKVDKDGAVKGLADIGKKPAVFATQLQTFTNTLKEFLEKNNVTLILVSGVNQNMNAGATSFSPDGGESLNKTRRGGRAINQSACLQFTVTRKGMYKDSKANTVGLMVRLRVVKNSYGPNYREMTYNLRNERFVDVDGKHQQAIEMDEAFCNILAERKVLGVTCTRKLYTCDRLGVTAVTAHELIEKINSDDEILIEVGRALDIAGYEADLDEH